MKNTGTDLKTVFKSVVVQRFRLGERYQFKDKDSLLEGRQIGGDVLEKLVASIFSTEERT
jgi:hypothetical protein